ncbi:MAG: hypothetical protein C0404_09085 [Verrucomicrobia bacterium]|nr:hypothetical protein [Verrucomicrobiota bacterium]
MTTPRVSIIMPMHNNRAYVRTAVESMLNQSFGDFEFIIVDDASTDDSASIVRSFADSRIRLVTNSENRGVAASLNIGIDSAKGEYLARMDADDVSMPDRLFRQVAFLDANRGVGICGSWILCFNEDRSHLFRYPTGADCVKAFLLLGNPLAHPSVCMRRDLLRNSGLRYNEETAAAQDYEFWTRCAAFTEMDNLAVPLLRYRVHSGSVTQSRGSKSDEYATAVVASQLGKLSATFSAEEISFHRRVGHGAGVGTREELDRVEEWLGKLRTLNAGQRIWPQRGLEEALGFVWFRVCQNSTGLGLWAWLRYRSSGLSQFHRLAVHERCLFGLGCLKGAVLPHPPTGNLDVWN